MTGPINELIQNTAIDIATRAQLTVEDATGKLHFVYGPQEIAYMIYQSIAAAYEMKPTSLPIKDVQDESKKKSKKSPRKEKKGSPKKSSKKRTPGTKSDKA